uniref:Putative heat shock protein 2 n=1 Tax=Davidia involucrata TaxID=16924 RepID=A0A5B7BT71_DAVIN
MKVNQWRKFSWERQRPSLSRLRSTNFSASSSTLYTAIKKYSFVIWSISLDLFELGAEFVDFFCYQQALDKIHFETLTDKSKIDAQPEPKILFDNHHRRLHQQC